MILSFVGNIMLSGLINEVLKYKPASYLFGNTIEILKRSDIVLANTISPIISKKTSDVFKTGNINSLPKITELVLYRIKGLKLGFLTCNNTNLLDSVNLVEIAKTAFDILVVSINWQSDKDPSVPFSQSDIAHQLVDAGADIVIGHGGHISKGVEKYKNRPIFYSTGDFVTDSKLVAGQDELESFIFQVEINSLKLRKVILTPILIKDLQTNLATGEKAVKIMEEIEEESLIFSTQFSWSEEPEYSLELMI
jgi:hypothetical protein